MRYDQTRRLRIESQTQPVSFMINYASIVLLTWPQANRPPLALDPRHAERARQTFDEARNAGVPLGEAMWAALLECQVQIHLSQSEQPC